ncbi:MAG: PIN domain-containing protein [bacterium]
MGITFMRVVCTVFGAIIGYAVALLLPDMEDPWFPNESGVTIVCALIGFMLAGVAYRNLIKFNRWFLELISKSSGLKILGGTFGAIAGILISYLMITMIFVTIIPPSTQQNQAYLIIIGFGLTVIMVYIFSFLISHLNFGKTGIAALTMESTPKILDTNVIIDGRINDIIKAGFVEGPVIVPASVLKELQKIADSPDPLKRNRGKLGLDNLNIMQDEMDVPIEIYDDFQDSTDEIADVDSHLVTLAKKLEGKVVTNDYNLHRVAVLQGIEVLNINELANALKPVVLPGENLKVQIIKQGKEAGQGVAYLDDGTMIVVEGGDNYIGKEINVSVTSILNTVAGRLIFARPQKQTAEAK